MHGHGIYKADEGTECEQEYLRCLFAESDNRSDSPVHTNGKHYNKRPRSRLEADIPGHFTPLTNEQGELYSIKLIQENEAKLQHWLAIAAEKEETQQRRQQEALEGVQMTRAMQIQAGIGVAANDVREVSSIGSPQPQPSTEGTTPKSHQPQPNTEGTTPKKHDRRYRCAPPSRSDPHSDTPQPPPPSSPNFEPPATSSGDDVYGTTLGDYTTGYASGPSLTTMLHSI